MNYRAMCKKLLSEVKSLRKLSADGYIMAGVSGAPVRFLDNFSAGAQGYPLPHLELLPVFVEEFDRCNPVSDPQMFEEDDAQG